MNRKLVIIASLASVWIVGGSARLAPAGSPESLVEVENLKQIPIAAGWLVEADFRTQGTETGWEVLAEAGGVQAIIAGTGDQIGGAILYFPGYMRPTPVTEETPPEEVVEVVSSFGSVLAPHWTGGPAWFADTMTTMFEILSMDYWNYVPTAGGQLSLIQGSGALVNRNQHGTFIAYLDAYGLAQAVACVPNARHEFCIAVETTPQYELPMFYYTTGEGEPLKLPPQDQ